jgi:hypothetical protein
MLKIQKERNNMWDYIQCGWLKHHAASRKVPVSIPDEINRFVFTIYLTLPEALWPWVLLGL